MALDGRYEVFDQVQTAHFGKVFDAHDTNLNIDVLVVEFDGKLTRDPGRWEQFWAQILRLADPKLENFVGVVFADKPSRRIVIHKSVGHMGDIGGHERSAGLPLDLGRSIVRQTLQTLKTLHAANILHGNIRPENIQYNNEGFVRLGFSPGLRIGDEVLKRTDDLKYTAPELLDSRFGEVGPGVDFYMLGFTMLEILGGDRFRSATADIQSAPIGANNAWMSWHTDRTSTVPSLLEVCPAAADPAFADICRTIDRMVAKVVSERYESAEEALADLSAGPELRVVLQSNVGPVPRNPKAHPTGPNVRHIEQPPSAPRKEPKRSVTPERPIERSPQDKPMRSQPGQFPKWSRDWINEQLKDPKVLYAVCGIIAVPTLLFLLFYNPKIKIEFRSTPEGAEILFNKTSLGKTPLKVEWTAGKEYDVVASLAGYRDATKKVDLSANDVKDQTIEIPLEKNEPEVTVAAVKFESQPAGSKIIVNSQDLGATPVTADLPVGNEYEVVASLNGYEEAKQRFFVARDEKEMTVKLTLKKLREKPSPPFVAKVTFTSEPAGAQITVDSKILGVTPLTTELNPAREFEVLATLANYQELKQKIAIGAADKERTVGLKLIPMVPFSTLPPGLEAVQGAPLSLLVAGMPTRVTLSKLKNLKVPLEFVLFAPGRFSFGIDAAKVPIEVGELASETVDIPHAFYISTTEVTNDQYAVFVKEKGPAAAANTQSHVTPTANADRGSHPVVNVDVSQAAAFCGWVQPSGRLPSEREWEHAARVDTGRLYPWGDGQQLTPSLCNVHFPADAGTGTATVAVDALGDVTPEGMRHMLGNVAEWCSDIYRAGQAENPSDPGVGHDPTIRGGSFKDLADHRLRLTRRANRGRSGADDIGFRVVIPLQ
jgi:formylglycine-generating enzyme required for sulfatase activity/serine/threonine protein kinase